MRSRVVLQFMHRISILQGMPTRTSPTSAQSFCSLKDVDVEAAAAAKAAETRTTINAQLIRVTEAYVNFRFLMQAVHVDEYQE